MNLLNNLIEIPILYLSAYISENKPEYYRLLNKVNKTDEWEAWILYMLKAIEETSIQTIEKITQIKDSFEKTVNIVAIKIPKSKRYSNCNYCPYKNK